jgi:hypothetical protein
VELKKKTNQENDSKKKKEIKRMGTKFENNLKKSNDQG